MIKFVRDDVDITARSSCRQINNCDRSICGSSTPPFICSTVCSTIGERSSTRMSYLRYIMLKFVRDDVDITA
jgi:hypothetical protein